MEWSSYAGTTAGEKSSVVERGQHVSAGGDHGLRCLPFATDLHVRVASLLGVASLLLCVASLLLGDLALANREGDGSGGHEPEGSRSCSKRCGGSVAYVGRCLLGAGRYGL